MLKRILTFFLLSCFLIPCVSAEIVLPAAPDAELEKPITNYERYIEKFDRKFDRGGLNFVAGWTEIVRQPVVYYQKGSKKTRVLKAFQGFGVGIWNGVADTVGGFANAVTSVFPGWEIPLPQGGITSKNITGGTPDDFQSKDEYKGISPNKTPRALYVS